MASPARETTLSGRLDTHAMEATLSKMILPAFSVGVYSEMKDLLLRSKASRFSKDPVSEATLLVEKATGSHRGCLALREWQKMKHVS